MNPLWAMLFKDRFRTPFSVYKMSLAEIVILLGLVAGAGIGIAKGVRWIFELEGTPPIVNDK